MSTALPRRKPKMFSCIHCGWGLIEGWSAIRDADGMPVAYLLVRYCGCRTLPHPRRGNP